MLYIFLEVVNILKSISPLVTVGEVCNKACDRHFLVFFVHCQRLSLSNTHCSNWNTPPHKPPFVSIPRPYLPLPPPSGN